MPETDKQEGQKTVVAFIAGLLIGGLLVWVFSSSPEDATPVQNTMDTGSTESVTTETRTTNTQSSSQTRSTQETTNVEPDVIRTGSIKVADQPAGAVVALSSTVFPTAEGWVIVRDLMDGIPGNILGAARYNESDGLIPESVSLLRATESGNSYQVVFFSENGDRVFDLSDDLEIQGVSASFTAQ